MTRQKEKEMLELLESIVTNDITDYQSKKIDSLISYLEKDLKPIKVRSAKNKGKNFQNQICEMISDETGIPWGTNEDFDIQSRQMGQHGVDVILLNEAKELFPFSIECKNTETLSLIPTIEQAVANVKEGTDWLVFYKNKKLKKPIAILDARLAIEKLSKKK